MSYERSTARTNYRGHNERLHKEALALLEQTATCLDDLRDLSPRIRARRLLSCLEKLSGPSSVTNLSRALLCYAYQVNTVQLSSTGLYRSKLLGAIGRPWDQVWLMIRVGALLSRLHEEGIPLTAALAGYSRRLSSLAQLDWHQLIPAQPEPDAQPRPEPGDCASDIEAAQPEPHVCRETPLLESVLAELKAVHALLDKLV